MARFSCGDSQQYLCTYFEEEKYDLNATDGAVFYLRASSGFYTNAHNITFTLVDMSSGSKKVYTYQTPTLKVLPLSNGVTIDAVTGSGGCAERAFSAIKLPAFTGVEDGNWKLQ